MADTPQQTPRSGFTLDLSSGASGKAKRPKGFVPVVQKTINLTTKRADVPRPEPAHPEQPRPEPARTPRPDARRSEPARSEAACTDARRGGERRPSGGTSLADLLDEATLARLRGEQS